MVHTGQHFDDELSAVFFDELGLPRPRPRAGHRARHEHVADGADAGRARAAPRSTSDPTSCSSTATRTRPSPARSPAPSRTCQSPTSRPGCGRSTDRCPRSSTACSPTTPARCCCARTAAGGRQPADARRVGGDVELVGDVMVDVALTVQPRGARARPTSSRRAESSPASYVLATAHRAGNVDDPASARPRSSSCCSRCRSRSSCRSTRGPEAR